MTAEKGKARVSRTVFSCAIAVAMAIDSLTPKLESNGSGSDDGTNR